jgi:hypothetical protein
MLLPYLVGNWKEAVSTRQKSLERGTDVNAWGLSRNPPEDIEGLGLYENENVWCSVGGTVRRRLKGIH